MYLGRDFLTHAFASDVNIIKNDETQLRRYHGYIWQCMICWVTLALESAACCDRKSDDVTGAYVMILFLTRNDLEHHPFDLFANSW